MSKDTKTPAKEGGPGRGGRGEGGQGDRQEVQPVHWSTYQASMPEVEGQEVTDD